MDELFSRLRYFTTGRDKRKCPKCPLPKPCPLPTPCPPEK